MKNRSYYTQPCVWFARGSGCPQLLILIVSRAPVNVPLHPQSQQGSLHRKWALNGEYAWIWALARVNGISIGIAGVHDGCLATDLCRQLAYEGDLAPFTLERPRERTILTEGELIAQICNATISANALITKPMTFDDSARALLVQLTGLPRYKALVADRSLRRNPTRFVEIAARSNYCQLNTADAHSMDATTWEREKLAVRVRYLLGGDNEFSLTDGRDPGLAWAEHDWLEIDSPLVQEADEPRTRDVFCSAYVVARRFGGAAGKDAIRYAADATTSWIRGEAPRRYM